jgi:hypothetical protein
VQADNNPHRAKRRKKEGNDMKSLGGGGESPAPAL